MDHITSIHTQAIKLPLKGKLQWGKSSTLQTLDHVLVWLETSGGFRGLAEAPARPSIYGETTSSIQSIIQEHLAPKLIGLALNDQDSIQTSLESIANNHTAKAAIDIALHEAIAAGQGRSLLTSYKGNKTHIEVSYILGIDHLDTMLKEAKSIAQKGVNVFKLKIGRDLKHDIELIKALSYELPSATLYADANEGLNVNAAQTLERLQALGIAYIEEPLPTKKLRGRSKLKQMTTLPIIADDSCFSLGDLERELAFDTFDILNIKPARTGIRQSQAMIKLAKEAGKGIMIGSQACSSLGSLHAAILASQKEISHPCELSFPLKLQKDTLSPGLSFKEGMLEVAQLDSMTLNPEFEP